MVADPKDFTIFDSANNDNSAPTSSASNSAQPTNPGSTSPSASTTDLEPKNQSSSSTPNSTNPNTPVSTTGSESETSSATGSAQPTSNEASSSATFFDRLYIKTLRQDFSLPLALSLITFLQDYELRDNLLINLKFGLLLDNTSSDPSASYSFREKRVQPSNFFTQIYFEDLVCFLHRLSNFYQQQFESIQDFSTQYPNLHEFIQVTRNLSAYGPLTFADYDSASKDFSFLEPQDLQEVARQFNEALNASAKAEVSAEAGEEQPQVAEPTKTEAEITTPSRRGLAEAEPESGEEAAAQEEAQAKKISDEELKITDLTREQANYIEGFIQIALSSNLAPLGIDLNSLPVEMRLALQQSARDQIVTYLLGQSKFRLDQLSNNTDNIRLKLLSEINHVLLINPGFTHLLQGAVNYHFEQAAPNLSEAEKQAFTEQLTGLKNNSVAYENELLKISLDPKYQDVFVGLSQLPGFNDSYRGDFLKELASLTGITDAEALAQRLTVLSPIADTIDAMLLEDLMNPNAYAGLEVLFSANLNQMQGLFGPVVQAENLEGLRQLMIRYFKQRHIAWAQKYRIFGVNLKQRELNLSQPEALQTADFNNYQGSITKLRNGFVSPLQSGNLENGDRAIDWLMGNPPADASFQEQDQVNGLITRQWVTYSQEEQSVYTAYNPALQALTRAHQLEHFSAIKALEAFLLYQNQLDPNTILSPNAYPIQALGSPSEPYFQQFGMNTANQVMGNMRGLASKAGDKFKEKAFDTALDVVAPGAGTALSQITKALEAVPIVGAPLAGFINQKKQDLMSMLLKALAIMAGALALPIVYLLGKAGGLGKIFAPAASKVIQSAAPSVGKGLTNAAYEGKHVAKDLGTMTRNKIFEPSKLGTKLGNTLLGGESTMSKLAFQSVLYPTLIVAGGTLIVMTVIQSAFLLSVPYAPVTQVKNASIYVDFRKDINASCGLNCTDYQFNKGPIKATYTLTIAPKGNYTIVINSLKDVLSVNTNRELSNATIADRVLENEALLKDTFPVTLKPGESKTITYEETFSDQYNHSNVRNNATISFTYQETDPETGAVTGSGDDQATYSKSLCIGECPISANVEIAEAILNAFKDCGYQKPSSNGAVSDSVFLNQSNWYVNVGEKTAAKACLLNHGLSDYVVNTLQTSVDRYNYVQCVGFAIASGEGKLEALGDAKNYCAANGIMGLSNDDEWSQLQVGDYVMAGSGAFGHIAIVYSSNGYQVQLIEADGSSGFMQIRGITLSDLKAKYCGFIRR